MTLEDLLEKYKNYDSAPDEKLIRRAYEFAEAAHVGEKRGEADFITHPLATAIILADVGVDKETLAAALLHDVLEHTNLERDDLAAEFGEEITTLVDGVSVVQQVSKKGAGENLRKLLLASARDPQVLLIRMAEEVDNLKNLDLFPKEKQTNIINKGMEIFAPLADLLGVGAFKNKLEDLAFQRTNPEEFAKIKAKIEGMVKEEGGRIDELEGKLKAELAKNRITAEVSGRTKHIFGVYRKLPRYEEKGKWSDVLGLRVITNKEGNCYKALDIVHQLGKPNPDLYMDYISQPKPNGYQSLHTNIQINSVPVEVQIRTKKMHEVAEFGLAAHPHYKERGESTITPEEKIKLLRNLIGWEKGKDLKLFTDTVFVFTPQADVIDLPKGATPVDFAFAVHTDIGKNCSGAKVDGKMISLDYQLKNGEVVEIVTAKGRKPSVDWLKFVKTDLARSQIKRALKKV